VIGRVLRVTAVVVAFAAAIDPPLSITARGRSRVAIITQDAAPDDILLTAMRIADMLRPEFDVVAGADAAADAVVAVGTEYFGSTSERQRAYTVTAAPRAGEPDLRIAVVHAPRTVPPGTLIHLDVDVDGVNAAGTTSTLTVRAGDVTVGRATHAWTSARERWRAAVDVTPLDTPPWRLRVDVSPAAAERALTDNRADTMVDVGDPLRVLVYEGRPSWASTFVRRALERDPRFTVASVSQPSRGVDVTAGEIDRAKASGGLRQIALDAFQLVVVGGLDRVGRDDAAALMRFLRAREGAVALVPDSRADLRAVGDLLPVPPANELLLEQPARLTDGVGLPPLEASETLTFAVAPGVRVLAANAAGEPAVVVAPVGAGRLLLSGALDAWRYRANDTAAFDRFWQAAFAGLAALSPPAVDVAVDPAVVAPGADAEVRVRIRGDAATVSAALGSNPIRLWPDAEPGAFRGSFVAPAAIGTAGIAVTADSTIGVGRFIVAAGARDARAASAPLSLLAASHGGIDVAPGDLSSLVRAIRRDIAAPRVRVTRRPMRSVWWMIPFAACLGGEWWLRRRRGLR